MNLMDIIRKLEKAVSETDNSSKKAKLLSELEQRKQDLAKMKQARGKKMEFPKFAGDE